jgi:hypothetical protein
MCIKTAVAALGVVGAPLCYPAVKGQPGVVSTRKIDFRPNRSDANTPAARRSPTRQGWVYVFCLGTGNALAGSSIRQRF